MARKGLQLAAFVAFLLSLAVGWRWWTTLPDPPLPNREALRVAGKLVPKYPNTPHPQPKMSQADRDRCESDGGYIVRLGMAQYEHCKHRLPDAGKLCTDTNQCTGICVASQRTYYPEGSWGPDHSRRFLFWGKPLGSCQVDDGEPFGCYMVMKNGEIAGGICVD